jgi:formylglycine-generating enzyme required for sulfatase activity
VSWQDANDYAAWLAEETGKRYRLPTEAEWEYAARADTKTKRFWGDEPEKACDYANVFDNANEAALKQKYGLSGEAHPCPDEFAETAPAGSFAANPWKLHDMLGNVWEWTQDCWHESYAGNPPMDGSAWLEAEGGDCQRRVLRGGSWYFEPRNVRSASRSGTASDYRSRLIGFRLARDIP